MLTGGGGVAGLSQHGCRQVRDDHLAGEDRHNYGHEMTPGSPGGLPVSLPDRLTDGLERGQDLAGAGLVVGGACGGVPLVGGGVHLHDLVLGLEGLVLHHRDGAGY